MKKQFFSYCFSLMMLLIIVACNNDNSYTSSEAPSSEDSSILFGFVEEPYQVNTEITRSVQSSQKQVVDLENGLEAEVTVEKDTIDSKPVTRAALSDGTYTVRAYQGTTLKGEITGTVQGGVFTNNSSMQLASGTYDFVCYNNQVSSTTTGLTATRGDALIGVQKDVVISNIPKQQVNFTMKHVGARMKVKIEAQMRIMYAITAKLSAPGNDIPATATFDYLGENPIYTNGAVDEETCTFPVSGSWDFQKQTATTTLNVQSTEYKHFLPTTNAAKIKLTFTGGNLYRKDLSGKGTFFTFSTPLNMERNSSYIIKLKLKPKFTYLFIDGTVGYISDNAGKKPVGLVIREKTASKEGMAIALTDGNSGKTLAWSKNVGQANTDMTDVFSTNFADEQGYRWTWLANGSKDGTTIKGSLSGNYPAFYHAGAYYTGQALSGSLTGKKWHLPSTGEWKIFWEYFGFGDTDIVIPTDYGYPKWYFYLAESAFTNTGVNGASMMTATGDDLYWSSTEARAGNANYIQVRPTYFAFYLGSFSKTDTGRHRVRAFILY